MANPNGSGGSILAMIGIPSYGQVSAQWVIARQQLSFPLGASTMDRWVLDPGMSIAEKRNLLCQEAINNNCRYLFMIGDDTIPPSTAFIQLMNKLRFSQTFENRKIGMVTGMYFSRSLPPQPMIWRGYMAGSYYDWHIGEFFPVDWAGCDCLLIDVEALRSVPPPWFSLDYIFSDEQARPLPLSTEDIYFYSKMKAAGWEVWCDAGIQCYHQDRHSGVSYFLPQDWPQAQPGSVIPSQDDSYLVADLGAGFSSPYTHGRLVRFDLDESVHPDVRCDLHSIPEPDCKYDEVWSRHSLEHFPMAEAASLVQEWSRILKVGGKLRLNVPNLQHALKVVEQAFDRPVDEDVPLNLTPAAEYAWWQIYGQQTAPLDFHKQGFFPRTLHKLVEYAWGEYPIHAEPDDGVGCFADIKVQVVGGDGENLECTARKVRHPKPAILGPGGRFDNGQGFDMTAEVESHPPQPQLPTADPFDGMDVTSKSMRGFFAARAKEAEVEAEEGAVP